VSTPLQERWKKKIFLYNIGLSVHAFDRARRQAMGDDTVRYLGGWIGRQRRLFPHVAEEIDPVTAKLEQLIIILDTLGWKPTWPHHRAGS
jgi:hypothetical protein